MREKFTANARGVMDMAVKYAVEMSCNYVGTEHILLGLINGKGVASTILYLETFERYIANPS